MEYTDSEVLRRHVRWYIISRNLNSVIMQTKNYAKFMQSDYAKFRQTVVLRQEAVQDPRVEEALDPPPACRVSDPAVDAG